MSSTRTITAVKRIDWEQRYHILILCLSDFKNAFDISQISHIHSLHLFPLVIINLCAYQMIMSMISNITPAILTKSSTVDEWLYIHTQRAPHLQRLESSELYSIWLMFLLSHINLRKLILKLMKNCSVFLLHFSIHVLSNILSIQPRIHFEKKTSRNHLFQSKSATHTQEEHLERL